MSSLIITNAFYVNAIGNFFLKKKNDKIYKIYI